MAVMKYKTTGRYSFGWSDPRGVLRSGGFARGSVLRPAGTPTQLEDVPTETLRNLWLAKWGQRAADADDVHAAYGAGDGILDVMQELSNRNLIRYETLYAMDKDMKIDYYVLEKAAYANS